MTSSQQECPPDFTGVYGRYNNISCQVTDRYFHGPHILHLYYYQWKDGLTLVCVGESEDMDGEMNFAMPLPVIIIV